MLTIFPIQEKTILSPILGNYTCVGHEQAVLEAREGEKQLGYLVLDVLQYDIVILDLIIEKSNNGDQSKEEKEQLIDSMIKAAISYGMNRNIFRVQSKQETILPLLKQFGFEYTGDRCVLDATKIIKKCNNCKN